MRTGETAFFCPFLLLLLCNTMLVDGDALRGFDPEREKHAVVSGATELLEQTLVFTDGFSIQNGISAILNSNRINICAKHFGVITKTNTKHFAKLGIGMPSGH